jgi:hypothetical protein
MKRYLLTRTTLLILIGALSCAQTWAQRKSGGSVEPLTNTEVVKLVRAGFKEKTVIAIISAREPRFDLSTERMIELKKSGVSEKIIIAMLARQQGLEPSDETWGDDAFFNESTNTKPKEPGQPSDSTNRSSTDIFGSTGTSSGKTKSRDGVGGSAESDTQTTGTATVRIIRPPTEAGGGALKLEKVATLNNDSIVDLVEAGFSEGTIIRRIEQSPVDFDFSPEKVAELRRHRVTDKILAAMKAAMGDNPKTNRTSSVPNGTAG